MVRNLLKYLILCCLTVTGIIIFALPSYADYSLTELRIAATISLEAGGSGGEDIRTAMRHAAQVMNEWYRSQKQYGATWSELLYGNKYWWENSRGFASKTKEELMKYVQKKSGNNWQYALQLAQKVQNGSAGTLSGKAVKFLDRAENKKYTYGATYVANGFIAGYGGRWGPGLDIVDQAYKRTVYFHTELGNKHAVAFNSHKEALNGLSDTSPRQTHDWDNAVVDKNINGATGNYSSSSGDGGGGSGSRATKTYAPSEGHQNRMKCSMDNIARSYGIDNDFCWYCDVVIIMSNAYFRAAGAALPSAIALGKLILQLGFVIWLAYYILQQVSSFAPVEISKVLQSILVMGFKVALASLAVDAANSVIIDFYVNPISGLGTDYGMAMYDKMAPTVSIPISRSDGGGGATSIGGGSDDFSGGGGGGVR